MKALYICICQYSVRCIYRSIHMYVVGRKFNLKSMTSQWQVTVRFINGSYLTQLYLIMHIYICM